MCHRHGITHSSGEAMGCDRDVTRDAGDDSKLASSSKFSSSTLKPPMRDPNSDWRRRSVDVGGLALALKTASLGDEQIETGMGWGSWGGYSEQEESEPSGTMYVFLGIKPIYMTLNEFLGMRSY